MNGTRKGRRERRSEESETAGRDDRDNWMSREGRRELEVKLRGLLERKKRG